MPLGPFRPLWDGLLALLESILRFYEGLVEPVAGPYAWGIAIILLTLTIRAALMPLMVKQTRSMREMQRIQPELQKVKEKYKVDRSMMRTDPEKYRQIKTEEREAQSAIMREHQVNPAAGCLPLVLQMPVFFALFRLLQGDRIAQIATAPWALVPSLGSTAADLFSDGKLFAVAGIGALILIVVQIATMFLQMQMSTGRTSTASASPEQAQVQAAMKYVMPGMIGFFSWRFPVGLVLYWVTSNIWSIAQQWFIFRTMDKEEEAAVEERQSERSEKLQRRQERAERAGASTAQREGGDAARRRREKRRGNRS